MKTYKDYEKYCIGSSDVAYLTVDDGNQYYRLTFGEDSVYKAYVVVRKDTEDVQIGTHYSKVFSTHGRIKVFDDNEKTFDSTKWVMAHDEEYLEMSKLNDSRLCMSDENYKKLNKYDFTKFYSNDINIYRAGELGCVIEIITK